MKLKNKTLAINSTLIVISTTLIGTITHELAHYLTADYFGLKPELHHNYVNFMTDNATELQKVIVAGAGPLFSLIFGIVTLFISIKLIKPNLFKLFMLWLGMNGILMFLGYILIAPIAKEGDTGKVFDYFNIPVSVSILIAIISFGVIIYLFSKLAKEFRFYKNEDAFKQNKNAKQLFFYPVLISILVITLLNLPVITWVSLLPTIFMPMTYFSTMGSYKKLKFNDAKMKIDSISTPLIILTICIIILFRLLI